VRGAADRACRGHELVGDHHHAGRFPVDPRLERHDLSSLRVLGGGGAAMPEAVARRLEEVIGLPYVEGYGLSETMAPTHINPPHRPKRQCGGIPIFNTDARVVDPTALRS